MPLTLVMGNAIRNMPNSVNNRQKQDARHLIGLVEYRHFFRPQQGNVLKDKNAPLVRLDAQDRIADGTDNLQIQLNGVHGHSTIAHVLIRPTCAVPDAPGNAPANLSDAVGNKRRYVVRKVRAALFQSLVHQVTFTVSGTPD